MSDLVTVSAWNVAHRTTRKPIPPALRKALALLDTDLVFLTEYVDDGPGRTELHTSLDRAGYRYLHVTARRQRHNQVLLASRLPFDIGDITAPGTDSHAVSNFLHVRLRNSEIEVIGIRAPAYTTAAQRNSYWQELNSILAAAGDRALVVAGDLNQDPFTGVEESVQTRAFPGAEMYSITRPSGPWSFINLHKESHRSRIDHALYTPRIQIGDVRYRYELEGLHLTGPAACDPLSDHAVLCFTAQPCMPAPNADTEVISKTVVPQPASLQRQAQQNPLGRSPSTAATPVPATGSSHRDEILSLLRRADCHYGAALRDEEAGLRIEQAAAARGQVRIDRIAELRRAVHLVADGGRSVTKTQAGHEEAVLRALLHFQQQISDRLLQHILTRLGQVQSEFELTQSTVPLRCVTRGANARRR